MCVYLLGRCSVTRVCCVNKHIAAARPFIPASPQLFHQVIKSSGRREQTGCHIRRRLESRSKLPILLWPTSRAWRSLRGCGVRLRYKSTLVPVVCILSFRRCNVHRCPFTGFLRESFPVASADINHVLRRVVVAVVYYAVLHNSPSSA